MARLDPIDALLLPLTWITRTRGRWRLLLLLGYGLVLGTIGALVGREAVLWKLPAAPEPFDLARYGHVDLSDADNAQVLYDRAARALIRGDRGAAEAERRSLNSASNGRDGPEEWDWARASAPTRAWAGANGVALGLWLEGAGRPDSLRVQPEALRTWTGSEPALDVRTLAHLGMLEATRRQAAGDLAGAWAYYRAALRSGLHPGHHAGADGAGIGASIVRAVAPGASSWADEPGMTADLLRRAGADLAACRSIQATLGDVLRVEYFAARAELAEPVAWADLGRSQLDARSWTTHAPGARWAWGWLQNEPKRSLKVLRLLAAGELAQCDRPYGTATRLAVPHDNIYRINDATPPALRRIAPADLAAWAEASRCRLGGLGQHGTLARSLRWRDDLIDAIRRQVACRAYTLDHAGRAARTYGDLWPAYLDAPPAGIAPGDPLAPP